MWTVFAHNVPSKSSLKVFVFRYFKVLHELASPWQLFRFPNVQLFRVPNLRPEIGYLVRFPVLFSSTGQNENSKHSSSSGCSCWLPKRFNLKVRNAPSRVLNSRFCMFSRTFDPPDRILCHKPCTFLLVHGVGRRRCHFRRWTWGDTLVW